MNSLIHGVPADAASATPAQPPVHILLGGNGENAAADALQADAASRVLLHCCTARDSVYALDLPHVYGLFVPASTYTGPVLRAMAFRGVRRLAVVFAGGSPLHAQLCGGALAQLPALAALRPGLGAVLARNYTAEQAADPGWWRDTADAIAAAGAEALIACDEAGRTSKLVRLLQSAGHRLHALWLSSYGSASELAGGGEWALTTAQWAPSLPYADSFFGSAADYAARFRAATGAEPNHFAAAASASGHLLLTALARSLAACDLTGPAAAAAAGGSSAAAAAADAFMWPGPSGGLTCRDPGARLGLVRNTSGSEALRATLDALWVPDSLFGPIAFNRFRQNFGRPPVVMQLQGGALRAVLPLDVAEAELVLPVPVPAPAPRSGARHWMSSAGGIVLITLACCLGAAVVVLAAAVVARRAAAAARCPDLSAAVEIAAQDIQVDMPPLLLPDGSTEPGEGTLRGARVKLLVLAELLPPDYLVAAATGGRANQTMLPASRSRASTLLGMQPLFARQSTQGGMVQQGLTAGATVPPSPVLSSSPGPALGALGRALLRGGSGPLGGSVSPAAQPAAQHGAAAVSGHDDRFFFRAISSSAVQPEPLPSSSPADTAAGPAAGPFSRPNTGPVPRMSLPVASGPVPVPFPSHERDRSAAGAWATAPQSGTSPRAGGSGMSSGVAGLVARRGLLSAALTGASNGGPPSPSPAPSISMLMRRPTSDWFGEEAPGVAAPLRTALSLDFSKRCRQQVLDLVYRASRLQHPHVAAILGIVWDWQLQPPAPPGSADSDSDAAPAPAPVRVPVLVRQWYEFDHLARLLENETVPLPLARKAAIAAGVAQGLAYLHAQEPAVAAGPLSASRIIIDRNFNPHLLPPLGNLGVKDDCCGHAHGHDCGDTGGGGWALRCMPRWLGGRAHAHCGGCAAPGAVTGGAAGGPGGPPGGALGRISTALPAGLLAGATGPSGSASPMSSPATPAATAVGPKPSSRQAADGAVPSLLTPSPRSPSRPSPAQDVYEFGLLLARLFVAEGPQPSTSGPLVQDERSSGGGSGGGPAEAEAADPGAAVAALVAVCPELAQLAAECMHPDPAARPTAVEVAQALQGQVVPAVCTRRMSIEPEGAAAGAAGPMGHLGAMGTATFLAQRRASWLSLGGMAAALPAVELRSASPAAPAVDYEAGGGGGGAGAWGAERASVAVRVHRGPSSKGTAALTRSTRPGSLDMRSTPQFRGLVMTPDDLLYDMFPPKVARALQAGEEVQPERYDVVSIFFSDVVGYTDLCAQLQPHEVMDLVHRLYSRFDAICGRLQLFKVETVGDAYLAVANLRHPQPACHARRLAAFAFAASAAAQCTPVHPGRPELGCVHIRVGLHAGPVVASVVGTMNRRYCLFGDAVNTAARMEHNSARDRVHCSAVFAGLLRAQWPEARLTSRGVLQIKGKGPMETFWVDEPNGLEAPLGGFNSLGSATDLCNPEADGRQ